MFISNNRASFHLWWKQTSVKHQKVSKHYANDWAWEKYKRNYKNWENHKNQRNFCANVFRKTKTVYFKNLNVHDLSVNRTFWKTIKAYFSNKGLKFNKLLLKETGDLVSDEKELETIMNNFFINITTDLELKKDSKCKLNNLEDILKAF